MVILSPRAMMCIIMFFVHVTILKACKTYTSIYVTETGLETPIQDMIIVHGQGTLIISNR